MSGFSYTIFRCSVSASLAVAQGLSCMWDLSSPIRDQTRVPCIGRQLLNHWTTREVPRSTILSAELELLNHTSNADLGSASAKMPAHGYNPLETVVLSSSLLTLAECQDLTLCSLGWLLWEGSVHFSFTSFWKSACGSSGNPWPWLLSPLSWEASKTTAHFHSSDDPYRQMPSEEKQCWPSAYFSEFLQPFRFRPGTFFKSILSVLWWLYGDEKKIYPACLVIFSRKLHPND